MPDRTTIAVGVVAPRRSQALDVVGPTDAFSQVSQVRGASVTYAVTLLGTEPGPITAASGIRMLPDRLISEVSEPFDTLLIAGSPNHEDGSRDVELLRWLAEIVPRTRRVGSICNGAFVLAAAGLLDGRRATTHWQFAKQLSDMYPKARIGPDQIFVRDGNIYTSAGVTAGIDLVLALIEQDCGAAVSLAVARALVVFLRRPGGQSQFSVHLKAQLTEHTQLGQVLDLVMDNLSADLSVGQLARHAGVSERSLTRLFHDELRTSPARFVEVARIEAARSLLEVGNLTIQQIAHRCGFGSTDTMRRTFLRHLQTAPGDYRRRFHVHEVSDEAEDRGY